MMASDSTVTGRGMKTPSPNSVYLLHVMAGCNNTVSMETAKYLMDSGQCGVNDQEPHDKLTPLHVAASWDNLLMCQLLVHYGADLIALSQDKYTPVDLAKGSSREFLRKMVKRGEKSRKRKIFKFLRHLFQPHKPKTLPTMPRSASTQCIPAPPQPPTLNQQIEDYLSNAPQYNARLSVNRFSGFQPATASTSTGHSEINANNAIIEGMQNLNMDNERTHPRTSSTSSYRTAPDEFGSQRLSCGQDNENSRPSSGSFANPPFPSLYPTDQLKKRSLESTKQPLQTTNEQSPRPEPSAPPLTPLVTKRRPKMSIQPDTMPRSSSLYAALVPRDIPPTSCKQSTVDDDEKPAVEDPILVDLTSKAAYLSLEELKVHLKRHVFSPGPLDKSNRKLYERKLAQLELNAMRGVEYEMKRKQMGFRYSIALERLIEAEEMSEKLTIGLLEEQLIQEEFKDPPRKDDISYFCYLLIDITELLPNPSFRDFIKAVFYVGKGKRSRPLHHFADTVKHRLNPKGEPSNKIAHIHQIWNQGLGIVSLHLFNNIHSAEALIREGAMIEAMTLENLDNKQRGTFSGQSKSWSRPRQAEFGAFLLKKAYNIYQNERCRPIFEADVINMKFW